MAYTASRDYTTKGGSRAGEGNPGRNVFPITAGASDLTSYPRALWLNAAGDVTGIPVDGADDTLRTFTAVPAGFFPMSFRRVTACPANTFGVI